MKIVGATDLGVF